MTYTADQITLKAHIEAENAKTQAWLDEADGRWAGMVVSDPEHWAGYDIYTVEQYQHYMAACSNFETYREINGIKPSWKRYEGMTVAEIDADTLAMGNACKARHEADMAEAIQLAEKLGCDVADLERWEVV